MSAAAGGIVDGMCQYCDSAVGEELLQCYDCRQWAHGKCADLSELEMSVLMGTNGSIQWVCRQCALEQTEKRVQIVAQLDELTRLTKQLSQRIEALEKGVACASSQQGVEEIIEEKPAEVLDGEVHTENTESSLTVDDGKVHTENTESSLTVDDLIEEEETDSSERKDEVMKVRELVENTYPEHQQESTEDPVHLGEVRGSTSAVLKCDDQQSAQQSLELLDRTFLQYSRSQLLQIPPAPLTPELTFHLHSLGIGVDLLTKQYRHIKTDSRHKLKCDDQRPAHQSLQVEQSGRTFLQYSRAELLQVTPAPLTPRLIFHLRSLGIARDSPTKQHQRTKTGNRGRLKCDDQQPVQQSFHIEQSGHAFLQYSHSQLLQISTESKQPELEDMPPPGSPRGAESGGNFSCFLCQAEGFTARGMEQHLWLCHKEESAEEQGTTYSCAFCPFTASCERDCQNHMNKEHPEQSTSHDLHSDSEMDGKPSQSPQPVPETSAGVDDTDAGFDIMETSLRLNDCPDEGDFPEQDDLSEDQNCEDVVNGDVDGNDSEAAKDDGTLEEESNLSVILGSEQITDRLQQPQKSQTSHTAGNITPAHHGGARPKVRPTPPTVSTDWQQSMSDWQASGSSVDDRERGEEMYTCPFCSFHTKSEGEIHDHVNQQHLREEEGEGQGPDADLLFLYSCPFCANGFDTPRDLSQHINTHHPDGAAGEASSSQHWPQRQGSSTDHRKQTSGGQGVLADLQCPVCGMVMEDGSEASLSVHVNQHFALSSDSLAPQVNPEDDLQMALKLQKEEDQRQHQENQKFKSIQAQYGMDSSTTAKQQFDRDLEHAAFKGQITISEFHTKKIAQAQSSRSGVDDGSTQVSGVLEKLRQFYDSRGCPRTVVRAHFCSSMHHYSGSYGDKGWGCGYRNLQMLLSCLMSDPTYLQVLFNGKAKIPSILKLQELIESAWRKGFDPQGCQQLGGALVNTRKWIGATEIVALLSSLRIKCQLLDFVKPSGPNNTHPVLIQWVRDYFTSPSSSFIPPLYLQHQGHSRTIVGIEELANGNTNLLLFDPGVPRDRMEQFHGHISYNLLQTIRKTVNAFRARQYQVVAVVGVLDEQEYERSKRIHSKRMS